MLYRESTSAGVVQAWLEPGSLKPRGGHHLEPQGSRAYSSAVPRVIFLYLPQARLLHAGRWRGASSYVASPGPEAYLP